MANHMRQSKYLSCQRKGYVKIANKPSGQRSILQSFAEKSNDEKKEEIDCVAESVHAMDLGESDVVDVVPEYPEFLNSGDGVILDKIEEKAQSEEKIPEAAADRARKLSRGRQHGKP